MSVQLLGKRELKRLGSVANDGAGAGYTSFAKGMMAKMGWAEGQGLGKDKQGMATYVQVKKKDDNSGLGKERAQQNSVNDQWYFDAFDSALANMGGKKKRKKDKKSKKRKEKKAKESAQEEDGETVCMYDKMFKATGGARMGMRARASQNGKLARTEGGHDGAGGDDGGDSSKNEIVEGSLVAVKEEKISALSHKRKRARVDAEADSSEQQQQPRIRVKQEKTSEKDVKQEAFVEGVKQELGEEVVAPKAERKRERSEAKKAKRATEKKAKGAPDGGGDGDGEKGGDVKARKKSSRKKLAAKDL